MGGSAVTFLCQGADLLIASVLLFKLLHNSSCVKLALLFNESTHFHHASFMVLSLIREVMTNILWHERARNFFDNFQIIVCYC